PAGSWERRWRRAFPALCDDSVRCTFGPVAAQPREEWAMAETEPSTGALADTMAPNETERQRLRALSGLYGPDTTPHLEALGVGEGWRCLEVGAGEGSIPAGCPPGSGRAQWSLPIWTPGSWTFQRRATSTCVATTSPSTHVPVRRST